MRARKSTFKNGQAWLSIEDNDADYLGTWHITNPKLVQTLKEQKGDIKLKFVD